MNNSDINLELIFDIKPAYSSVTFLEVDFDIVIKVQKNGQLIQSFFSPLSTPIELFSSLKDILKGKSTEVMISTSKLGHYLQFYQDLSKSANSSVLNLLIIPPSFELNN